ncbi:MAG: Protein TonB, partial [Bacteroidota bacterium]
EKITKVELKSIETPKKDEPKKIIEQKAEPVKQTKSIVDVVKFVPPVIVDKQTVDTPPPTIDDLKDKKTGASDVKASTDADADLNLDGSDSNRNVDADNTDYSQIFTSVEVNPEPPGGINAFRTKVQNGLLGSLGDLEESLDGSVRIRFVVMEDGSLGSFEVLEENPRGYKLADKAIQQIKKSPKWKAGVMNGRNVKVYYSFPLKFHISAE